MIRRWLAIVAMFLSLASAIAAPLEMSTDAERTWRELRNSDDVKTKLMAERWYGAVKLQEWGDASGKFKTTAKYVAHDPNLAWVKLRVIQGVGSQRVVKDVTIPLEKLSKAGQARVRQISVLADKVAEAVAEEQKKESEGEMQGGARGGERRDEQERAEDSRGGRGEYGAGLAGMDADQALAERNGPRGSRDPRQSRDPRIGFPSESATAAESASVVASVSADPLPAMLPPVPNRTSKAPDDRAPADATASNRSSSPSFPDNEPWRTSYEVFLANIVVHDRGRGSLIIEWGVLEALKQAQALSQQAINSGNDSPENNDPVAQQLEAVGEFSWEATLAQAADEQGDWTASLGLPPMPPPFSLKFVRDSERDPGQLQRLEAGDRVRFIGRFLGFEGEYGLIAAIRFPAEQPSATEPPSRDERGR